MRLVNRAHDLDIGAGSTGLFAPTGEPILSARKPRTP
jgi:hypothetical protein